MAEDLTVEPVPKHCDVCGSADPHGPHGAEIAEDRQHEVLPCPTSFTRKQVCEALQTLGVDPDIVYSAEFVLGGHSVRLVLHVNGMKYPRELTDAGILYPGVLVEIPIVEQFPDAQP